MFKRDYIDVAGGIFLFASGVIFAWYATTHYNVGTFNRMGPGMFPAISGLLLSAFGILQAIPAVFRTGKIPEVQTVTLVCIGGGIAAFAILIVPFGLFPAVVAVAVISGLAELKIRPLSFFLLPAVLCLVSWLIFHVALGLSIPLLRWPF